GRLEEVGAGEWLVRAGVGFRDRPGVPLPDLTLEDAAQRALLAGDGALRRNSDVRKIDAFFASRYQRDSGAWFSTSVSGFAAERGVPPEFHESDPRLWRYPDQKRLVAAVSAGTGLRDTGWGRGDLEAAVGIDVGSFTIESFDDLDYRTVTETEEGDDRTLTLRLLGDHSVGERADLRAALTYGDVSHDEVLMPGGRNAFRQRLWSLATELDVRGDALLGLPGTKGTRLTFGVAVDGSDTPETGDKPPVERLWDWGARVGLSTLLSDELRVHGGLSRRVRFPSLRELYSGALGRFLPNPDLGPERMVGAELGFTLHHGGHDIQVVGFRQVLSDGIVRVSVDTPEGRKRQRVNQDRVRALGLEVLTSGTWRRFSYAADLTWQSVWQFDARGDRTRPEYEPDLTGSFSVATRLAAGIMGTGEFGYLGTQYCLDSDAGGLRRLDDASSLDLGLRRFFRLGRGPFSTLDASVRVQNVTDAAVLDQCGLPRPGRTLQVQARVF
ncbi:MAG: TonB-dependent receptor, partial [Gemmatimonadetes bacterium]